MSNEVISLASETSAAPTKSGSNYVAISEAAELVGGGSVYLSRNRKAVARWQPGEAKPPVFLTSDSGQVQQSVPYRAVGTALAHGVIPMAQVCELYASNGRVAELVAALVANHAAELAAELVDNHADFALALMSDDDGADADTGAEEEVPTLAE